MSGDLCLCDTVHALNSVACSHISKNKIFPHTWPLNQAKLHKCVHTVYSHIHRSSLWVKPFCHIQQLQKYITITFMLLLLYPVGKEGGDGRVCSLFPIIYWWKQTETKSVRLKYRTIKYRWCLKGCVLYYYTFYIMFISHPFKKKWCLRLMLQSNVYACYSDWHKQMLISGKNEIYKEKVYVCVGLGKRILLCLNSEKLTN